MKYLIVLPLLFTFLVSCAQQPDPYPPSPVPDRIVLTWSADPATTQSVTWRTDVSVKFAFAQIAVADGSPDFTGIADSVDAVTVPLITNNNAAHYHSVTFNQLNPDTKYAYRVGNGEYWSEWFHFRTASDQNAPFSFIYFGDAQNNVKSMWSRVIREAYSGLPKVDFILHAGDLINRAANDAEWGEWFYAGGWIYGSTSNIATPGNHEYYSEDAESERKLSPHWRPGFTLPENGPEGLEETVYYIDYQDTRIISLNTQVMFGREEAVDQQKQWLEEVLQNNPNRWTIVTHHHPIYSTAGGRDNKSIRKALQPLYEQYQVDLVLQGHDHTYGRGHNVAYGAQHENQGPIYVVSVSGPKMYDLSFDDWLDRVGSNTQLYQYIHVNGDNLKYEAYTATGVLYDAFRLTKEQSGKPNEFVDLAPDIPENYDLPARYEEAFTPEQIEEYNRRFNEYKKRKTGQ